MSDWIFAGIAEKAFKQGLEVGLYAAAAAAFVSFLLGYSFGKSRAK